jgi:hypothetical protein
MFIVLPIIFFILTTLLIEGYQKDIRQSLLFSAVVFGFFVTVITEILSVFTLFNSTSLISLWLALDLITIAVYIKKHPALGLTLLRILSDDNRTSLRSKSLLIQLIGITLSALGIGVVALVAAPNHSDSMEYRLVRVMHWLQNSSVYHYPTHNIFQLYQNPWSEFTIAHFQVLSQSDIFAASVQYFSLLGCLIGTSLIARELGSKLPGQIVGSVFCLTIPMGILQASSTNSDYVVSLWLTIFVYLILRTVQYGTNLVYLLGLGVTLGLAILTKGTVYIYVFPFCLWLLIWGVRHYALKVWQPISIVGIITIAINSGHYLRNFLLFGSPLGAPGGELIQQIKPTFVISNTIKQLALHADIVRYFRIDSIFPPLLGKLNKAIDIFHGIIRVDLNEPLLTSPKFGDFYVPSISFNEDNAGNPLHLLLIAVAFVLLFLNQRMPKRSLHFTYALVLVAGFLLFSTLLTWSPARCRLHLPFFVLYSGFVGSILAASFRYKYVALLSALMLTFSSPWITKNATRPMWAESNIFNTSRMEQYFKTQPELFPLYADSALELESMGCQNVGLYFENISFEYPFWRLLARHHKTINIQHVNVENVSAQKLGGANSQQALCAVVSISVHSQQERLSEDFLLDQNYLYRQSWVKMIELNKKYAAIQIFAPIVSRS